MNLKVTSVLSPILLFCGLANMQAAAPPPAIFYSDLQSGPKTGGENNNGAYITIYGARFGSSQGVSYVTVGSGQAINYKVWTDSKITFQLGPNASSGNIAVTTSAGTSTGLPFTVRSGNIYFVATNGNNSNQGTTAQPWATIPYAASTMVPGDITYVRNGVNGSADNGYGSPLNLSGRNGTAASPFALVVYPGESASIGGSGNTRGIIQYPNTSSYWTLAGFTMTFPSSPEAIHLYQGSGNWRIIANSISCPNGDGFTGCVTTDGAPNVDFLGNTIHDTGATNAVKTYHAFYFGDHGTTGNVNINVGWNHVYNIHGCRGIMFHSIDSTPGAEGYNLKIHDNLVHDTQCDGISLANVNPTKGPIQVYNNVVYHVGTGPDPQGNSANYSCFYFGDTNGNPTVPVDVYNNTCYDGGSRGASQGDAGAYTTYIPLKLRNNITFQLSGEAYFSNSTVKQCPNCISGSNNLWFGAGAPPTQTTGNISADPNFVNAAGRDFRIQSSSPAINAGIAIPGLLTDVAGVARAQSGAIDLGAFQFAAATAITPPAASACDLNGDGTVDSDDVDVAISQALGSTACSNSDLDKSGVCNVVDVQRVTNGIGGSCRVGL
jgi:hypothetical protein